MRYEKDEQTELERGIISIIPSPFRMRYIETNQIAIHPSGHEPQNEGSVTRLSISNSRRHRMNDKNYLALSDYLITPAVALVESVWIE